jgi:hypothetical protein
MQVGVSAAEDQADVVAAAVAVIGAVKRLVDVSDEMHDELERFQPLARWRRGQDQSGRAEQVARWKCPSCTN